MLAPVPMPKALHVMAPGSSIFSDGLFDLRLSSSEHRSARRGIQQEGLRVLPDGLPLTSLHLRAFRASIARRWGVGFDGFSAVGSIPCWLAPPLALDYHYRLPSDLETLRSCAVGVKVLIPINLCNEHWLLGEADMTPGSLTLFDSDIAATSRHSVGTPGSGPSTRLLATIGARRPMTVLSTQWLI